MNVLAPHLYEDDEADEGAGDDDADVDGGQTGASLYLQAGHTLVPPVVLQLGKMVDGQYCAHRRIRSVNETSRNITVPDYSSY